MSAWGGGELHGEGLINEERSKLTGWAAASRCSGGPAAAVGRDAAAQTGLQQEAAGRQEHVETSLADALLAYLFSHWIRVCFCIRLLLKSKEKLSGLQKAFRHHPEGAKTFLRAEERM